MFHVKHCNLPHLMLEPHHSLDPTFNHQTWSFVEEHLGSGIGVNSLTKNALGLCGFDVPRETLFTDSSF